MPTFATSKGNNNTSTERRQLVNHCQEFMKITFNLQQALSSRREMVIAKHCELTKEKYFDGCTLRQFMVEIMNACTMNNIRSDKRLGNMLPYLMGDIYFNHSKITDAWIDNELRNHIDA